MHFYALCAHFSHHWCTLGMDFSLMLFHEQDVNVDRTVQLISLHVDTVFMLASLSTARVHLYPYSEHDILQSIYFM